MARKIERVIVFPARGRAADESRRIVSAIRAGRLTRRQFDAWYTKRRSGGKGLVITLRERAPASGRPAKHSAHKSKER